MTSLPSLSRPEPIIDDRLPPDPYPGLRPFKKAEWPVFFGRDRMITDVLSRLAKTSLVVVHGSSGSGKSSLILAGVLPRLELEHARHGVPWKTVTMRPGSAPLWHLAEALAALVHQEKPEDPLPLKLVREIRRTLNRGKSALADLARSHGLGEQGHVCVVLDQFEELFRFAREIDRDEAEILSEVLRGFEDSPPHGLHAIITMRSDHLGDCGRFYGLAELINQTQYLLPRMDKDALLRAIREPARLYQGGVTIDLALKLIEDSAGEQDVLPLVQHCLMRMWRAAKPSEKPLTPGLAESAPPKWQGRRQMSPERVLDLPGYHGLREMLSSHADEILADLVGSNGDMDRIVEHLFRALTDLDVEGRAIRYPHRLHQLVAITGSDRVALLRVVNRFRQPDCSFLTPLSDRPLNDEDMVDIGHEALIRCWRRLDDPRIDKSTGRPRGWLQREQEDERIWRSMLVQAETGDSISASAIDDRAAWFSSLPGPGWAERYGGGWDLIKDLVALSQQAVRRAKQIRFATIAVFVGLGLALAAARWIYLRDLNAALDADLQTQRNYDAKNAEPVTASATLKDCDQCPELVVIPAGSFLMGSPANEEGRREAESPLHEVSLGAFAIGQYEVTFAEWDACVAEKGCSHTPVDEGWGRDNRPVINVSWDDTQEYITWLSKKTAQTYRVPSEAEWEYAARAGTTTRYFWGDEIGADLANCDGCGSAWDNRQTAPAGSFIPNDFGLYDMSGNVWEWVEDSWHGDYEGAPTDGSAWVEGKDSERVLRGGSWNSNPVDLRSADRNRYLPDNRNSTVGFRVSRTLTP